MKKSLLVANWKMNGALAENEPLLSAIAYATVEESVEVSLCVPYIYLFQAIALLAETPISYGAQDVSLFADSGAYTGEISASMLADVGCDYVIIGHSERRQLLNENDDMVATKLIRALDAGITPIICVGETLEEREAGQALVRVSEQVEAALCLLPDGVEHDIVIAYEPLWAIGTGQVAQSEQIAQMHSTIANVLEERGLTEVRIIYGGSVKPANAAEIFAIPNVDGALVGGASLVAEAFLFLIDLLQRKS